MRASKAAAGFRPFQGALRFRQGRIRSRPHREGNGVHADEAASWDNLHERFEIKRINHQEAYSLDGACTNMAEEYFSRPQRAKLGIHQNIAGSYLLRYAQESFWRENNRRVSTRFYWVKPAACELPFCGWITDCRALLGKPPAA
jgi:ISXO2-like transposase domain